MVLERIAALQALVVGLIFAWAGIWKVASSDARRLAMKSVLGKILPTPQMTVAAHVLVGIGELAVALLLLASPWYGLGFRVATVFTLGFLGYLALAWRIAPEQPCACIGGRATPLSRRSLLRAITLFALTLVGWDAREYWAAGLVAAPWVLLIILVEVFALWLLSPEFGWTGVRLERRIIRAARLRINPTCAGVPIDWDATERKLRTTAVFLLLAPSLSAITDRWREDCWSFISFAASYENRTATAVFAIPTLFDPQEVSAAVVDDGSNATMLTIPSERGTLPPAQ
ncbi:MAG TPA: MauE/DoxX family redox-associated membrane protein [Ktedonobacterales bacterium]|nr:MauE/DoxX family redox-associated membrane protein [Ktedonobacterales bacterium]